MTHKFSKVCVTGNELQIPTWWKLKQICLIMPKNYQILPLKVIISENYVFVKSINTGHLQKFNSKISWNFYLAKVSSLIISFLYQTRTVSYWVKNANVVHVHEKISKQILTNYWVVSLLRIFGKIFERLIYNKLYECLIGNNLISLDHSDFNPGDPWICQLLSIIHDIYQHLARILKLMHFSWYI